MIYRLKNRVLKNKLVEKVGFFIVRPPLERTGYPGRTRGFISSPGR